MPMKPHLQETCSKSPICLNLLRLKEGKPEVCPHGEEAKHSPSSPEALQVTQTFQLQDCLLMS